MADSRRLFAPRWLPLITGGLPHTDPAAAWKALLTRFPEVPAWPRLPRRSNLENMYTQYSERFPGISLDNGGILVDRNADLDLGLERLYLAYLEGDLSYGETSAEYASALDSLLKGEVVLPAAPLAIKGEITGPVSWGLTIVDQERHPILYDEVLEDAVAKHLRLKAAWQEHALSRLCPQTLMVVNEPYMSSYGTASVSLSPTRIVEMFEDVFDGLSGLKGIQCSGTTDWALLMSTSADLISFDAYDYIESLASVAEDLARFVDRGGLLAWGIVPAGGAARSESVEALVARLESDLDLLAEAGVSRERLVSQAMISPSASLAALSVPLAEHILDLTNDVSRVMQERYCTDKPEPEPSDAGATPKEQ
ncbi:MAG: methionine synthase [Anaerolineae bacterium]